MQQRVLFVTTVGVSARAFTSGHIQLMERGQWDITVACADDGQMQQWADSMGDVCFRDVPMVRDPSPIRDLFAFLQLVRIIKLDSPDIVIYGTPKASLLTSVAAFLCRVPSRVYVIHGLRYESATGLRRAVLKFFERITHAVSTSSVGVSKSVAKRVAYDLSAESAVLGEGSIAGVDTNYFTLSPSAGAQNGHLRLVFVGRVCVDKGAERIVKICAELEKRGIPYTLDMVGPDELGRDELGLRRSLSQIGNVRMHGRQDDVRPFLWAADVLLLPSSREGLGLVLLEAAACGVPSVATEVTGCMDVLRDSKMGILVPVDAGPERWVEEIEHIAEKTGSRECRLGIREEVISRFDKDLVCSRWISYYCSEVARRKSIS